MELAFIASAVRRSAALVIGLVMVGFVLGWLASDAGEQEYHSEAILLVTPPSESQVQLNFVNDPDRYVLGQITLLESAGFAEAVAELVAEPAGAAADDTGTAGTDGAADDTEADGTDGAADDTGTAGTDGAADDTEADGTDGAADDAETAGTDGAADDAETAGTDTAANGITTREIAAEIAAGVSFTRDVQTDVVRIEGRFADPETARAVVDGYVDVYFETVRGQVEAALDPELAELDLRLQSLLDEIFEIDAQIAAAVEPFLPEPGATTPGQALPGAESLVPELVSRRDALRQQYGQVLTTRTQLESSNRLRVTSQVVQRATTPTEPETTTDLALPAIGGVAGLLAGVLAALAVAQLWPRATGRDHVAEVLGAPVVADLPPWRGLERDPLGSMDDMPPEISLVVDQLCVQAGAGVGADQMLSVAVVGSQPGAGSSTVALSMATRYAQAGSKVLLVDMDTAFSGPSSPHARWPATTTDPPARDESDRAFEEWLSPTHVDGLFIAGSTGGWDGRGDVDGSGGGGAPLQRRAVADLMMVASRHVDTIVFDGGSVLERPAAVLVSENADAVVVTVPLARQDARRLERVASRLSRVAGELLIVNTGRSRRTRERPHSTGRTGPSSDHLPVREPDDSVGTR